MAAAIDVPNLDHMEPDELRAFAATLDGRDDADETTRETMNRLWRYALLRADAMEQRLAGRIEQALRISAQCDGIYRRLPPDYQW